MVGISIARRTRSGKLVGPGIWRKCLPVCTVMARPSRDYLGFARLEYHYLAGLSPARAAPSILKKSALPCKGEPPDAEMWASHEIEPMATTRAEKVRKSAENSALS